MPGIEKEPSSSRFIRVTDTPATSCAGCGMPLDSDETYCCKECVDFWLMTDPNGLMGVDDD